MVGDPTGEATSGAGDDIRPQERLLIEASADLYAGRVLCNTVGRAQFARSLAAAHAQAHVTCLFLDIYQRDQAAAAAQSQPNLRLVCQPDPPDERFDLAALAVSQRGEAELTRELLQAAHVRLNEGGQLVAATDNPHDKWLHQQMRALFDRVSRRPSPLGVAYVATKGAPLKRIRRFDCEFPCRDGARLLQLRTRPGVFSHRHVDPGARALLSVMDVRPGLRVLDIGCGSGVVGIAAAARAPDVEVLALDSNPRAVEATRWAAEHNLLSHVRAELDADGRTVPEGVFDLVLANPPYYSHFRISEIFLQTALKALRPQGELLVVTKRPEWYLERLAIACADLETLPARRYAIIRAKRR